MTWEALKDVITLDRASFLIAFAALVVALHSAKQSRRNADAAERSAKFAEVQSQAAKAQSQSAREQAIESRAAAVEAGRSVEVAHVSVLEAARARIDSLAPKAVIAVEKVPWPPRLTEFAGAKGDRDRERSTEDLPITLNFMDDRFLRIAFTVRGIIINDGAHSMRVSPDGPAFISGYSPILGREVSIPPTVDPAWMEVLLKPGEAALFEWEASKILERWIESFDDPRKEPDLSARFVLSPGSKDQYLSTVDIVLDVEPIEPASWDKKSWRESLLASQWKIPEFSYTNRVRIGQPVRHYPEDVERLKRDLMPEMWSR
ncbi:hypothetical protein [Micromonospora sagamiensis]|uniref:Uncharacterized protein n=1 Tax=Micromonospora sagamiensis TaxID=47875 RepID=A0A562WNH0_9ACTN|nr:hypothetical protein [Micromonospora sagamiensis]TWJ30934.1 hypothetical protein JD81_04483 [Micromonospora sagamiensis]BCL16025.1 hypothetical protein GCM10017556_37640 [Micromonospora sagamiensis]